MALIMVADDDPNLVMLLTDFLESRGHQVVSVTDGLQVAEKAQDWRPEIIVSDIQMPNVYGTTAFGVLQEHTLTKNIPVIFVTGVPIENAKKIVPVGPKVRLLPKPLDLAALDQTVTELLKTKS